MELKIVDRKEEKGLQRAALSGGRRAGAYSYFMLQEGELGKRPEDAEGDEKIERN